ncbi:MAG TPA: methyltransferase domain-containing protein [Pyrinomonadaceae bacterium]
MSEIKDAEIDVAGLMVAIREAAAKRKAEEGMSLDEASVPPATPPASSNGIQTNIGHELPRLSLRTEHALHSANAPQSEEYQHSQDRYALEELLRYYDAEFIEHAYRAILKREPEGTGYALYLEHLRNGRFDRIDILYSLRSSAEGKERNVKIEGLPGRALLRRLYRLPLLGYLVEWLVGVVKLPLLIREQRRFDGYSQAQQERIQARQEERFQEQQERLRDQQERFQVQQEQIAAHINQVCEHIDQVNASVFDQFQKLNEDINRLAEIEEARRQAMSEQLEARLQGIDEQLQARMDGVVEQMQAQSIHFSQHAEHVAQRLQATRAELLLQEKRTQRLLEQARGLSPLPSVQQPQQAIAEEERHLSDAFYAELEEHFRGSREEIMRRLQVYLPILREGGITTGILDIGTGRGEWLEVLRQEGIEASGVDMNSVQVEACAARGLEVTHDDALNHLRGLPDASLNAVTGFHIIEHLEFEALVSLLDEIMRTLAQNGLVIFETPNPENVSVTGHNFYVDPTHRNPLPIPMMKFLLESRGFYKIKVLRLHPSDTPVVEGEGDLIARFNDYFYGPMDYAILGSKA